MEEILIGNAKIAEFDGWHFVDDDKQMFPNGYYYKDDKTLVMNGISEIKYHTSYDLLMPVVDKIEGLGFDSRICGHPSDSGNLCDFVDFENNEAACYSSFEEDKIIVLWKTILQFIDWHNLNVKNK
jgi:hypothetical protein